MSSGAQGPEGMATGETSAEPCLVPCFVLGPVLRVPAGVVGPDVGPLACEPVSATGVAWSGPDEPSLEPPSSRAIPTTSSIASEYASSPVAQPGIQTRS